METLYGALVAEPRLFWGGGILALLLTAGALATRWLPWPRALSLMMGVFSLGTGAFFVLSGIRYCANIYAHTSMGLGGEKTEVTICNRWESSPFLAVSGLLVIAGAALALMAGLRPGPPRLTSKLLLASSLLTLPEVLLGMSPASLAIGLAPPLTLLVLGMRSWRAA